MNINLLHLVLYVVVALFAVLIVKSDYRRMTYVLAQSNKYAVRRNNAVDRHERRIDAVRNRVVSLMSKGNTPAAVRVAHSKTNPYAKAPSLNTLFNADNKGVYGKTVAGNTAHYALRLWRYGLLTLVPEWKIASAPLTERNNGMATLRMMLNSNPALAWMKDDKAIALFVKGMDTSAFLAYMGIEIVMTKGVGPVFKRISRVFGQASMYINTVESAVRIQYVRRGIVRMLSQDGAGWVSRSYMMHMAEMRIKDEALNADEAAALRIEAKRTRRVSYVVLDRKGEWKGHANVVNTNKWDLKLIDGQVKGDIRRTDERVYIAFQAAHSSTLFLDVQSSINLGKFFESKLVGWAHEYLQNYLTKLNDGTAIDAIVTDPPVR